MDINIKNSMKNINYNPHNLLVIAKYFFSPQPTRVLAYSKNLGFPDLLILFLAQILFNSLAWTFTFSNFIGKMSIDPILKAFFNNLSNWKFFLITILVNTLVLAIFIVIWHVINLLINGESKLFDVLNYALVSLFPSIILSILCIIVAFLSYQISLILLISGVIMILQFVVSNYDNNLKNYRIDKYWIFVAMHLVWIFIIYLILRTTYVPLIIDQLLKFK